jgi:hypothetical protein
MRNCIGWPSRCEKWCAWTIVQMPPSQLHTCWLLAWAVMEAGAGHTGATEPRSGVRAAPPRSVEMCCMDGK